MKKSRIYIDNCVISAYLNLNERDNDIITFFEYCRIENVQLVVSQTIFREAILLKDADGNAKPIDDIREETRKFIDNNLMLLRYTQDIGYLTQEISWKTNCKPSDAEHIASCILNKIPILCTLDNNMIKVSNKINNMTFNQEEISINICEPKKFKTN